MKLSEILSSARQMESPYSRTALESLASYPTAILDILIYHRLHFHMDPVTALKSYRQLGSEFVDWNEVRISPIREIQEQVSRGENSLELSVFIKDLLEFVHADKHKVDLEHLAEENLTDIRRYLKQVRNIEPASIELVLMLRKAHPVVPLTATMEAVLLDLGLIRAQDSRDRRQKALYELSGPEDALAFHHLVLNYSRGEKSLEEKHYLSPNSALGRIGKEFGKVVSRKRAKARASGGTKKAKKKTTKRKTKKKSRA